MAGKRSKLQASPTQARALANYQQAQDDLRRQQQAERAADREERQLSRPGIRAAIDLAKTRGEEVEYVNNGPIRFPERDGLLWLVSHKKITATARDAAERYRRDYTVVHGGQLRSCIDERIGSGQGYGSLDAIVAARQALERAREKALSRDGPFIWITDEVAGKGTTIRYLAGENDRRATELEIEFRVCCRLLARHYGLMT